LHLDQFICLNLQAGDGSGVSLKSVREDVLDLLSIGVERRRILNYVWNTSGRKLFAGDLSNIAKDIKDKLREVPEQRAEHLLEQLRGEVVLLCIIIFVSNVKPTREIQEFFSLFI